MKKLKLEIDALRVESFEPHARPEQGRGTVEAREVTALADTCGCADTSVKVPCFCSERQTCWDCT
jgi:hypothetical protein